MSCPSLVVVCCLLLFAFFFFFVTEPLAPCVLLIAAQEVDECQDAGPVADSVSLQMVEECKRQLSTLQALHRAKLQDAELEQFQHACKLLSQQHIGWWLSAYLSSGYMVCVCVCVELALELDFGDQHLVALIHTCLCSSKRPTAGDG